MSLPSLPPSHFAPAPISKGLMRALRVTSAGVRVIPAPSREPSSYEVRLRGGVGDTVFVVGHDRNGEPMIELRVKRRHLSAKVVDRMGRWCRENDDEPDIRILP